MEKREFIFGIILIAALLIGGLAYADQSQSALAQEMGCRINFNIGVLNSMNSNSSPNIQQSITTLQKDLSQIQSLNNNTEVQNFAKEQYSNDMKSVVSSAQSFRKGMSLDQRASMVSSYNQLQATYTQCEQQVYTAIGQQRLQQYQSQITNFQNQTSNLQNRGFNVTSLNQLLSNAQTQIIQPLQSALSSANNSQAIMSAVKSYCLFDGCANGTNFHLDANFGITRLSIVLNDLQTNAAAFNLDNATLSQAQQDLSNAQTTLSSVGTSAYQPGQSQTIFSNLQNASKLIVQLITQAMKQPVGALK